MRSSPARKYGAVPTASATIRVRSPGAHRATSFQSRLRTTVIASKGAPAIPPNGSR